MSHSMRLILMCKRSAFQVLLNNQGLSKADRGQSAYCA